MRASSHHSQLTLADPQSPLTSIGLGSNGITAVGVKALANVLRTNRTLASLGLGSNRIGAIAQCHVG